MSISYEIDGISKSFEDWCKEFNRRPLIIQARLSMGMSLKEALHMIDNTRDIIFCINGKSNTFQYWCKFFNISSSTVRRRLKSGMSIEDAFSIEVDSSIRIKNIKLFNVDGKEKTLTELSKEYNINQSTISSRLRRGETIKEALDIIPSTRKQFSINKQTKVARYSYFEMDGEIKTLSAWCNQFNISYDTAKDRLLAGHDIKKVFSIQVKNKPRIYNLNGVEMTIAELSNTFGINKNSLKNWLAQGLKLEEALAKKAWDNPSKYRHIPRDGMKKIHGETLKHIREKQKISQNKLAILLKEKGCNLNRNAIGRIEKNEWLVSDEEVNAIAEALYINILELFCH